MYGGGLNGKRSRHKRAGAPKRRNGATKAQQIAARRILAESGVEIRPEAVEAAIQTLRR